MRRGAGRGQPRPEDGTRREGGLRLGHVLEVLQDGPRRPPLPPTARVPPRLREPGGASAPARQRAPPRVAPAVPHPALRARRRRLQDRGPLLLVRAVALRPHRWLAHRPSPPRGLQGRRAGAPAHAQDRPPRRRLPLLRRPGRRRPPHARRSPAPPPSNTARPWPTTRPSSASRRVGGTTRGAAVQPDREGPGQRLRHPRPGRRQLDRGVGRRDPRPRRRRASPVHPSGQGHPRDGPGRPPAVRHRRRHPGAPRTSGRSSSSRGPGRTSSTSGRPIPATPARSTTPRPRPRTSTTCSTRRTTSPRRA